MPIEVEVKAYAKNLDLLEEKISSLGAKLIWQGEQRDTYYNHPSRNFAESDEALRIREEEGNAVLTYKGPKLDSKSKTRKEIKVQVEDPHQFKDILNMLGFKEVGVVRKHRKKLLLGEFKVCLDKVENLGEFVEIEAIAQSDDLNDKVGNLRDSILKTLEDLGLKDLERRSYLELLYPEIC